MSGRGTIVLVHGLGEHSGRYERLGRELRADGWSTIVYDQRGHGRTPGPRGAILNDSVLLDDLATMLGKADVRPLVLFGHSMGGLVASRFVAEGRGEVDALVLSSPALAAKLSVADRTKLALGRLLAPDRPVKNGLDSTKISHDPEVVRAYQNDPLVHDRITPRLANFILEGGVLVRARAAQWRVPTLLLYAGDDHLVDAAGSAEFAARAPKDVVRAQVFPTLYHEIFNEAEPGRSAVTGALREWLNTVVK